MSFLKRCRDRVRSSPVLYSLVLEPIQRLRMALPTEFRRYCRKMVRTALACPDNGHIRRAPGAGRIIRGLQVMHNGILVPKGGYYNYSLQLVLQKNRGVHEPQQVRAFGEVLRHVPKNAVMIELGAYWGFYSMWFHQVVESPECFLVEPEGLNLELGRRDFEFNGMRGSFHRAFVGSSSGTGRDGVREVCIDDFISENEIEHVHILHSDIQGAELEMLKGAKRAIEGGRISFLFVSSHSNSLHQECCSFLRNCGLLILASASPDQSYSFDGLIVARARQAKGPESLAISLRSPEKDI